MGRHCVCKARTGMKAMQPNAIHCCCGLPRHTTTSFDAADVDREGIHQLADSYGCILQYLQQHFTTCCCLQSSQNNISSCMTYGLRRIAHVSGTTGEQA